MANESTLTGSTLSASVATDPSLCRVSGYLKDMQGFPLKGVGLVIRNGYDPIAQAATTLFLGERVQPKTDRDGYVQFDLLRGSLVSVELPNRLFDHTLQCLVPDSASIDLIDFLFPHVVSVSWVTTSPAAVEVGEVIVVELEATLSNGEVIELTGESTTLVSSDDAILLKDSGFSFSGQSAGSVTLTVDEFDQTLLEGVLKEPDGTSIVIQDLVEPTLPSTITIVVS